MGRNYGYRALQPKGFLPKVKEFFCGTLESKPFFTSKRSVPHPTILNLLSCMEESQFIKVQKVAYLSGVSVSVLSRMFTFRSIILDSTLHGVFQAIGFQLLIKNFACELMNDRKNIVRHFVRHRITLLRKIYQKLYVTATTP